MYNFNLIKDEEVIGIYDNVFIKQDENEKYTTIAITNKRLLFLDYLVANEGMEVLRIARTTSYPKYKDVYYQINLKDIKSITKNKYYKISLITNVSFEFDNKELYELLEKQLMI
ncbi:MAG: hypothetical protein J6C28_03455 [Bacilli bacterium]|nr:hypothetical protein [Bacilli bacterium]